MGRPPVYDIINDYEKSSNSYVMSNPHWIILVIGLSNPVTYSRSTFKSLKLEGEDDNGGVGVRSRMIITDDCLGLNVANSKGSYIKTLNANLKTANINYISNILPGDWILAWIVNSRDRFDSLLGRLGNDTAEFPCNLFNDGLKFVGRAHDIRLNLDVEPSSGMKTSNVSLSAIGFNELSTQFFFNPFLAAVIDSRDELQNWYAKIGLSGDFFTKILSVDKNNTNTIIPTILDIVIGKGVLKGIGKDYTDKGLPSPAVGQTNTEAPFAYIVPQEVGNILGRSSDERSKKSGFLSYADLLELWIGIQNYSPEGGMTPDNLSDESTLNRKVTNNPVLGTFFNPPTFANKPLWSQVQQYINPEINEMYTSLKLNESGFVVPQIVVRQIPFTTEAFKPGPESLVVTKFLTLPRWKIPSLLIRSLSVGRSDSTRCNFVQITASALDHVDANTGPQQMATNKPIVDDIDIQRSGLRAHITKVDCHVADTKDQSPSSWMTLVADWKIGSHLTMNGTISCLGIQAPIAEGDNAQFDNLIFHIESVNHNCGIGPDGKKFFNTQLSLTNGMEDIDSDEKKVFPSYPGLFQRENPAVDADQTQIEGAENQGLGVRGDGTIDSPGRFGGLSETPLGTDLPKTIKVV